MADFTAVRSHIARKKHRCNWCGQLVVPGENYARYRSFEDGEAYTVKMHSECHDASGELPAGDSYCPHEMKRGSIEDPHANP